MCNWWVTESATPTVTLLLAHGAGAGAESDFMQDMATQLSELDVRVVRFNFPYMTQIADTGKKRPPDSMPKLEAHFKNVIEQALHKWPDAPLFIGGKSMGGRVATLIAHDTDAVGVIALGYPFHPPGKPEKLRTEHLMLFEKPLLIVQGERDTFGNRQEVEGYSLPERISTLYLTDGDHSFKPRKASGFTQSAHIASAAQRCAAFFREQQ